MKLNKGTRVVWTDPDGGNTQAGTVSKAFDSEESEVVFILTDDGGELEALLEELKVETMTHDHGFISLGKYSSARDSILHYLCLSEWSNDSFGDVEAPTGYAWRIDNDPADVHIPNSEITSVLSDWFDDNPEVKDSPELRAELVGHFLVVEDSNGFVSVHEYPSGMQLMQTFQSLEETWAEWNAQDD
jgi:hypothetical protein